ncbi:WcbI family polysaccharide biosynthesis putative acetyltransferase [Lacisediminimonas profundi]|uniref:WcbI family polysaccharide biosynthesis putative acetyltransferase n=1 Tax=Lacisediminimonas profundi TaxID=2603856 RepID=UPI00124BBC3E|nr:WcbI family polysaccharide biosynthesis putative acetyltransferase [Lacisediminimonas profundi]
MPHLVISSNCQTAGLAATLAEIFHGNVVTPLPLPQFANDGEEAQFAEQLKSADVWVSLGQFGLVEKYRLRDAKPGFRLIKAPPLGFPAFHPDLCYARRISTNELVVPHYNSAIVVWAYRNGLSPEDAARLFTRSNYESLGYLDAWGPSVAHLRQVFANFDMREEFDKFYLHMKRRGNFMYSINHPRSDALVQLGKIIATKIGCSKDVYEQDIQISDGLTDVIWPLYPEVADGLALEGGSYQWKLGGHLRMEGVRNYVDFAYNNYRTVGIEPADIAIAYFDESRLDAVLGAQARTAR